MAANGRKKTSPKSAGKKRAKKTAPRKRPSSKADKTIAAPSKTDDASNQTRRAKEKRAADGKKPLEHDNGKGRGRRTAAQVARQERVFDLSVLHGKTIRQIAAEEGITHGTVISDLRYEGERRAAELEGQRDLERARSIAYYQAVSKMALDKGAMYDGIAKAGGKVVDHTLDALLKARERIDKILGVDAPTKIDLGLSVLLDALAPPAEK